MTESISYQGFDEKIFTRKLKKSSEILPVELGKGRKIIKKMKATIYSLIGNPSAKTINNEKARTDVRIGIANNMISNRNIFLF